MLNVQANKSQSIPSGKLIVAPNDTSKLNDLDDLRKMIDELRKMIGDLESHHEKDYEYLLSLIENNQSNIELDTIDDKWNYLAVTLVFPMNTNYMSEMFFKKITNEKKLMVLSSSPYNIYILNDNSINKLQELYDDMTTTYVDKIGTYNSYTELVEYYIRNCGFVKPNKLFLARSYANSGAYYGDTFRIKSSTPLYTIGPYDPVGIWNMIIDIVKTNSIVYRSNAGSYTLDLKPGMNVLVNNIGHLYPTLFEKPTNSSVFVS